MGRFNTKNLTGAHEILWIALLLIGVFVVASYLVYNPIKDPANFIKLKILENNYYIIRQEALKICNKMIFSDNCEIPLYNNDPLLVNGNLENLLLVKGNLEDSLLVKGNLEDPLIVNNKPKDSLLVTNNYIDCLLMKDGKIINDYVKQHCPLTSKLLQSISNINSAKFLIVKINSKLDNNKLLENELLVNNVKKNVRFIYNLCLSGQNEIIVNKEKIKQGPKKVIIFDSLYKNFIVNNSNNDPVISLYIDFNN